MHSSARGYCLIAAAACCWGASAVLGRAMFTGQFGLRPMGPLALTQARNTIAALLLLPALLVSRGGARRLRLPRRAAWQAVGLGVIGMSASNYFYYLAIQRTTVAIAVVIQYTTPIWVLVYMVGRGRQRATPARVASVLLALLGIALVLGLGRPGTFDRLDAVGVGGAALAAFAFAYYNIGGRGLSLRADPILIALHMLVGAAAFWLFVHPPWAWAWATWSWPAAVFLLVFALLATLAPTLLYISGLQYLDPTRAVVTSCLEPVSGILLAVVTLGELLAWLQVAGVACVIGAILISQRGEDASAAVAA